MMNFTELYARGTVTAPQGRLTLQTQTPMMTTTQAAKTTIFYTPSAGSLVPIWDGSSFVMTSIGTELSVLTTDTTKSPAAIGASKCNDWYVWSDAGTVRLGHGPDWPSDTSRGVVVAPVKVTGIWVNNSPITNGPTTFFGTWVGATRSNASSQLDWIYGGLAAGGTAGFFGIANAYNQVEVRTLVSDSTDSWTYGTATWRASNAAGTGSGLNMRASYIDPHGTSTIAARNYGYISHAGGFAVAGIGVDSTSAFSGTTATVGATIGTPGVCGICRHSRTRVAFYASDRIRNRGRGGHLSRRQRHPGLFANRAVVRFQSMRWTDGRRHAA